jgi:glucan 1,3-beta-glucosidase
VNDLSAIELMNEPRISDANFTMSELKAYYSAASQIVRESSGGSLRVLIHDAFWGPGYWSGFNPVENTTSTSPEWLDIDLHNYFAFAPNNNLPQDTIIEKICNTSQYLRNTPALSPVLVGEWSLETGTAPNASPLGRAAQSQARRSWFRKLFEAQLAAYSGYGWYFWTWKTECKPSSSFYCKGDLIQALTTDEINTWSYRRGIQDGWIPPNVGNTSQLIFPILANGCINSSFDYTAPSSPEPQYGGARGSYQVRKNFMVAFSTLVATATWFL